MSRHCRDLLEQLEAEDRQSSPNRGVAAASSTSKPATSTDYATSMNEIVVGVPRRVRGLRDHGSEICELAASDAPTLVPSHTKLAAATTTASVRADTHPDDRGAGALAGLDAEELRAELALLPPMLRAVTQDWRAAAQDADIADAAAAPPIFPDMPSYADVVEQAAFVRESLARNALSSADAASARMAARIVERGADIAESKTQNYIERERTVLRWVLRSQQSTVRAVRADEQQLRAFIQYREIALNRCVSVLNCVHASLARIFAAAKIERSCAREATLLPLVGRARLMLTSADVSKREQVDLDERLAALPYRDTAVQLFHLVEEIQLKTRPQKDLAAAWSRIRAAEELADTIVRQTRATEVVEEGRYRESTTRYNEVMKEMNSADVDAVEEGQGKVLVPKRRAKVQ